MDAVQDGRELGARAGLDVGRTAHDDLGDGQAADQAGDDVARALGEQFAVGRRVALVGVEAIGRFDAEQGLDAGDDREGRRGQVDGGVGQVRPARETEQRGNLGEALQHRHVDQVAR